MHPSTRGYTQPRIFNQSKVMLYLRLLMHMRRDCTSKSDFSRAVSPIRRHVAGRRGTVHVLYAIFEVTLDSTYSTRSTLRRNYSTVKRNWPNITAYPSQPPNYQQKVMRPQYCTVGIAAV